MAASRCSRGTSRLTFSPKKLEGWSAAGRTHQVAPCFQAGFASWKASHIPTIVPGSMLPSSRR